MNEIDLSSMLLFRQNPEALEAVKNGEAKISAGGIRRLDGTLMDQAKPALITAADLLSMVEEKSQAMDSSEQLKYLQSRIDLSEEGLTILQEVEWLNNSLIQHTYTMTYKGFQQVLAGLENVSQNISKLDTYIRQRDIKDTFDTALTYKRYLNTDAGNLRSSRFDVTNSSIAEHLDQISTFIQRLWNDIIQGTGEPYMYLQVMLALLKPYSYLLRKYSMAYFCENEFLPANYDEWLSAIKVLLKDRTYRNKLTYYIRLNTLLPYKDQLALTRRISSETSWLLRNAQYDKKYMLSEGKEAVLSLPQRIIEKSENPDFIMEDGTKCIFL